jgi:hypothetical protein
LKAKGTIRARARIWLSSIKEREKTKGKMFKKNTKHKNE